MHTSQSVITHFFFFSAKRMLLILAILNPTNHIAWGGKSDLPQDREFLRSQDCRLVGLSGGSVLLVYLARTFTSP